MATRNIVPNNDSEGNIGAAIKRWIKGWFVDVYVSGSITDGTDSVTVNQLANPTGGGDLLSTNNLSDVANAVTSLSNLSGEPAFSKNTAFNKNFGTAAGTVLEGNTVLGGGVFTPTINSTNMVEVSQESDFGTAVGSVITLTTNTTYFVRGSVSCSNRLLINTEGIAIIGWDRDKDGLDYTGSGGDFITVTDVNFEIANLKLSSGNSVGGEVVLRASNFNYGTYNDGRLKVLTLINLQFRGCYDVHHIEGFDLVDIQNCLFWYIQATTMGCHFKNCSKLQVTSCEYVRWFRESTIPTPGGYATASMIELLANGAGNGFGAVNITGCIIHAQQTQNGIDINTGSTTGFGTVSSNAFVNVGLTTGVVFLGDALTPANGAYSETECLKYDVFANQGIPNSSAYGSFYDSTSGTDTLTGGTTNWIPVEYGAVPVAAGTQRVSFSTPATQRGLLTYNGTKTIFAQISVSFTYNDTTGGTDQYNFGLSKNGGSTPETGSILNTKASGGAYSGVTVLFTDTMVTGDDYELLAQNNAGLASDNIEVISVQFLIKE